MRLSLDTSAYRAFVDGNPAIVQAVQEASQVAFSVVVLGELRAGFRHGKKRHENGEMLRQALSRRRVSVLALTESTSVIYAEIWSDLRKKGTPIPTNDVWIAAQCLEHELTLLTLDVHFRKVTELQLFPGHPAA